MPAQKETKLSDAENENTKEEEKKQRKKEKETRYQDRIQGWIRKGKGSVIC